MAQSGTTFVIRTNGGGKGTYQGRYMELECHSTQDIANNVTNISWTLRSIGGSSSWYGTKCYVYINGVNVYSIDKGWSYKQFPVAKGETSSSTSVQMKPDGSHAPITVYMDVGVYVDSTDYYGDTWQLDTIPRYPTINGFTVDKVWQNSTGLTFNWSADSTIDYLWYSTNDGASWSGYDTADGTSGSFTVWGLASNTWYGCKIRLRRRDSQLTQDSGTYWQATYPQPSANIWTENIGGYNGLSQIKVNWSSNINIAKVGFSSDNGANYIYFDVNTTSGNYTFTGLNEGQTYNFRISVEASDGHCISVSGTSSRATHSRVRGNLYVNNTLVATNNWQGGVELKNGDTLEIRDVVNGANCSYKLFFENPDNQNGWAGATQTGTTTVSMSTEQVRQRLQYMSATNSQDFNVGLTTLDNNGNQALYYEFFGTIRVVNSNPTFDINRWTYQDTNATTVALTGSNQILVNGFSKLRVNIGTAATPQNYATISQYIVGGCTNGSSTTTGNIDCATATNGGTITVTAKDTRGNSTPTTRNATYKDYFVPTMANISATRGSGGVGTITTLAFNGTWWNGNFGASANTLSASYRYKSGSTWSTARTITLTTSGNNYSFNDTIYGDLDANGFTLGTTFTIEVTITDELNGGRSWQTILNSGTPAIAISESNLALGGQYDTSKGGKLQVYENGGLIANLETNGTLELKNAIVRDLGSGQVTIPETTLAWVGGSTDGIGVSYQAPTNDQGITKIYTEDDSNAEIKVGNNVSGTFKEALRIWDGNVQMGTVGHTYLGNANGTTGFSINGEHGSNIHWKENGFGDKFNIVPLFGGADDDNQLHIQGAVGGAGEDPALYDLMTITGKSGNVAVKGNLWNGGNFSTNGTLQMGSTQRNTVDTWIPVLRNGYFDYTLRHIGNGNPPHTDWPNNQDYLATLGTLSFWNGAYNSGGSSNLRYGYQGEIAFKPTILYDNGSGEWGTVTLSDYVWNYSFIEVYYSDQVDVNLARFCAKVSYPHGKGTEVMMITQSGDNMRINCQNLYFYDNHITRQYGQARYMNDNDKYQVLEMPITMVVGYK